MSEITRDHQDLVRALKAYDRRHAEFMAVMAAVRDEDDLRFAAAERERMTYRTVRLDAAWRDYYEKFLTWVRSR